MNVLYFKETAITNAFDVNVKTPKNTLLTRANLTNGVCRATCVFIFFSFKCTALSQLQLWILPFYALHWQPCWFCPIYAVHLFSGACWERFGENKVAAHFIFPANTHMQYVVCAEWYIRWLRMSPIVHKMWFKTVRISYSVLHYAGRSGGNPFCDRCLIYMTAPTADGCRWLAYHWLGELRPSYWRHANSQLGSKTADGHMQTAWIFR